MWQLRSIRFGDDAGSRAGLIDQFPGPYRAISTGRVPVRLPIPSRGFCIARVRDGDDSTALDSQFQDGT